MLKNDSTTEKVKDSTKADDIDDLLGASADSTKIENQKNLFTYLFPNVAQNQQQMSSLVAQAKVQDTAKVNSLLADKSVRALLPTNLKYVKFLWDYKAQTSADGSEDIIGLYAIKSNRNDQATIDGDVIADAKQDYDQLSKPSSTVIVPPEI